MRYRITILLALFALAPWGAGESVEIVYVRDGEEHRVVTPLSKR